MSHNLAAVESLCASALLLAGGTVACQGSAQTCIAKYHETNTSAILGPQRLANNEFEISRVEIRPYESELITTFSSAEIQIEFSIKSDFATAAHIYIEDAHGSLILGLDAADFCQEKAERERRHCWRFVISNLPLLPGDYYLRILMRNDTHFRGWRVPTRFQFTVQNSAIYGPRTVPREHFGLVGVRADVTLLTRS